MKMTIPCTLMEWKFCPILFSGRTALMEASIGNCLPVAQQLVNFGCHINVMDKHGYTALSDAVCGGRLSMVDLLLLGINDRSFHLLKLDSVMSHSIMSLVLIYFDIFFFCSWGRCEHSRFKRSFCATH